MKSVQAARSAITWQTGRVDLDGSLLMINPDFASELVRPQGGSIFGGYRTPRGSQFRGERDDFSPTNQGYESYAYMEGSTRTLKREFNAFEPRSGFAWARRARHRSDEEIRSAILDCYRDELQIWENRDLEVDVQNGIVTLRGAMPNRAAKVLAGEIAWSCSGVQDVFNLIEIR